jgi:hypothetical protein
VLVAAASVVVGHGVRRLCGYVQFSWTGGPVGLATLIVIASIGARLPGHAVTGFVLLALAVVASLRVAGEIPLREGAGVGALAMAAACLPFIAVGRVGILGVGDNADLVGHLVLADAIGHGRDPAGLDPTWWPAYPVGPHSLASALSRGLGFRLDGVFEGLLIAAVAVAAVGALAALRGLPGVRRAVGAVLAALPFLVAAYVIQSSFKEPIQVALLAGWALALPEAAVAVGRRRGALVPLALVAAGCFATFSMVGLVWPAVVAAAWLALRVVDQRRLPRVGRETVMAGGLFLLVAFVAALPQLSRASKFFGGAKAAASGATTGGNVRADVPAYEVSGIWPASDFRLLGEHPTQARLLGVAGLAVAAWAAWWCWRRRRFEFVALVAGGAAVYVPSRLSATPYYGAKALTIAAAGLMLMTVTAILTALPRVRELTSLRPARIAATAAGVAFLALAAWSSSTALRAARVAPADHEGELAEFRPIVSGQATLYMGANDYIAWYLRGAKLAFPYSYLGSSQVPIETRPEKPWAITQPFDFDSVDSPVLDRLRFAIASRAPYASEPPANWRVARTTKSFVLYERKGPTPPRAILPEGSAPGAPLDCESSKPPGSEASVMADPVLVGPDGYRLSPDGGGGVARGQYDFASVGTDVSVWAQLNLPAGRWQLSLQYVSPTAVDVSSGSARQRLPASIEGPGVFWHAASVKSRGEPVWVELRAATPAPLAKFRTVLFGTLAATRDTRPLRRHVPMAQGCGRYVDWYRPL